MFTIGVLCSGGLGLETVSRIVKEYTIQFILTDRNSKGIIDFAAKHKIPFFAGNPRKGKGYNFIKDFNVDVIASINYLFLIEADIINHSKAITFNIHGSLLPKYRGRTPHVWAIIHGEKKAGITAHVIDEGCDTGDIIHQIEVPIHEDDTGGMILAKYAEQYFPLVKRVLQDVKNNDLELKTQNEEEATYFGKRTPEDGEINWNWSKEDIRNWVRAQANPYPGAFTYYLDQKVIIDKVSYTSEEYASNMTNGEIVQLKPNVAVKVKNGIIHLDRIRTENCTFAIGNIFGNENRK